MRVPAMAMPTLMMIEMNILGCGVGGCQVLMMCEWMGVIHVWVLCREKEESWNTKTYLSRRRDDGVGYTSVSDMHVGSRGGEFC